MPQPTYDAIVIGTGPGGATVAREMSRRNKRVLMLERGPDGPIHGDLRQYIVEQCVPGKSLLLTEQGLAMVRAMTVGGSSLFYYATAFAERVIVSAGGIGSPVILRRSGIRGVGRNFFFDPLVTVCGECADGPIKQGNEIPMSTGCHMEEEGYVMTDMAVPDLLDNLFAAGVIRPKGLFRSSRTLRIMVKARDDLGGRLTPREGIRKKLNTADRRKLLRGAKRAKGILEQAGVKNIYRTGYLAAHPGGTVKIGEHLDARLSTRIDRLHVCDCSVIPEPWGMPPTLTLVGLGKHLARVLCGEKSLRKTTASKPKRLYP